MVWRNTDPMSERIQFIAAWLKAEDSVTGLSGAVRYIAQDGLQVD